MQTRSVIMMCKPAKVSDYDRNVYSFCRKTWSPIQIQGETPPQARTFHRAIAYRNLMFVLGGFDGSRLNDMYLLPLPQQNTRTPVSMRPASSSTSGIM